MTWSSPFPPPTSPTHPVPPPPPPSAGAVDEARRTGAVWVAGTGAFLLLAAAAVFVGVRWDRIPDSAKLAIAVALTGLCLAAGRAMRRALPATGDVLFHLGALLVPIDLAAVGVRAGLGWREQLLAQGVLAMALFPALARCTSSSVLGWAALASVPVTACGVAATTDLPAPLLVAIAAVAALAAGWRAAATVWAGVAGLAPVAAVAGLWLSPEGRVLPGRGVLIELGVSGRAQALGVAASGVLAGWVLLAEARRRGEVGLAACAWLSAFGGAATAWVAADLGAATWVVGVPATFVLVQLTALLAARDPRWWSAASVLAAAAEVPMALVSCVVALGVPVVVLGGSLQRDLVACVGASLLAFGWVVAGGRRVGATATVRRFLAGAVDDATVALATVAALVAVVAGTGSSVAGAVAAIGLAAVLASTSATVAHGVAGTLALVAPLAVGPDHPLLAAPFAVAAAACAALAATRRWRLGASHGGGSVVLAGVALTTLLLGVSVTAAAGHAEAVWLGYVVGCWALGWFLDRAEVVLGHVARGGLLIAVAATATLDPRGGAVLAAAVTVAYVVEAIRLRSAMLRFAPALTLQAVVVLAAEAAGLDAPSTGVAAALAAVVLTGWAGLADRRWRQPLLAAAAGAVATGVALAGADPVALGTVLLISGTLGVTAGLLESQPVGAHAGAAVATLGFVLHLDAAEVSAVEAYLAPVVLQALVAGAQARRRDRRLSSWLAFAPAVALFGGAALAERVVGGSGWHAVVAGGVGVVAVAAGGWRRLAGPLVVGTALVGATTVHESLAALAGVPTWGWLAAGGAVLLGAGVALEQSGRTPLDAGRRLADVVAERFG